MSTTKARTLSIQNLNQLYFQFFQRYVTPNLYKDIKQITELLRKTTAYEAFNYLQELLRHNWSQTSNQATPNQQFSISSHSLSNLNDTNQYTFPITHGQVPKSVHSQFIHTQEKSADKAKEESTIKNKAYLRRTLTGLPSEDIVKPFQFNRHKDDHDHAIVKRKVGEGVTEPHKETNAEIQSPLKKIPMLLGTGNKFNFELEEPKSNLFKQITEKLSKIFNANHSKIQKYNNTSNQSHKLFNLNFSTRIEKKQVQKVNVKEFQFSGRGDYHVRKL